MTEANKKVKEMLDLDLVIVFRKLGSTVRKMEVHTYSDASFSIVSEPTYGQTGIFTGLMLTGHKDESIFHIVDWACTKQKGSATVRMERRYSPVLKQRTEVSMSKKQLIRLQGTSLSRVYYRSIHVVH